MEWQEKYRKIHGVINSGRTEDLRKLVPTKNEYSHMVVPVKKDKRLLAEDDEKCIACEIIKIWKIQIRKCQSN